eukprot:CAMPEP_0181173144 /NCGR_PEP_ID=MMETSP1096-20121128/2837_1 /TAXON_ID=156174 ORGANISM="Chrysochromulina ericina, Strain CCMP281" /NCGR_SAMPLE_ID=MMETSP1096 /ASSEMBLY_ACC=CAM_ASM_000453 /LENGTH=137 /DNA_ID=CAMNT_0023260941 /DNA_START=251 /DNA_END=660 /DNA_ORIENTATION=+
MTLDDSLSTKVAGWRSCGSLATILCPAAISQRLSLRVLAARAACKADPTGISPTPCEPAELGGDIRKLLMRAALRPVRSAALPRLLSFMFGSSEKKAARGGSASHMPRLDPGRDVTSSSSLTSSTSTGDGTDHTSAP